MLTRLAQPTDGIPPVTDHAPPPARDGQDAWHRVRARLLAEVGQATFASWLAPLILVAIEGDQVTLGVGTRFLRDWVASRYAHRIAALWAEERHGVQSARIVIHAGQPQAGEGEPRTAGEAPTARRGSGNLARAQGGALADLGSPLNGRFTFREFVVGETNELAHAAAQQVAGVDHLPFNPLYLYGGVGLGKTHLLHATAWCIRGREPGRRVLYLSAERFMYRFVQAIRQKDTVAFKEKLRSADVLLIDDIQFICDKESTQEEFLHTLNALLDHRCQVVVSGDRSPSRLDGMGERLRSRLAGGLAVDILPANYELRLGILRERRRRWGSQMHARGAGVPGPADLVERARARDGPQSHCRPCRPPGRRDNAANDPVGSARRSWRKERRITIEEIQRRVAAHYNIKPAELSSNRRAQVVVRPRHVAMYLAKQLTSRSLPEIGRKFGKRDHTTVMYAIRRIEELRPKDAGSRRRRGVSPAKPRRPESLTAGECERSVAR